MAVTNKLEAFGGDVHLDAAGIGLVYGAAIQIPFPSIASLADGVAATTVQSKVHVPFPHRVRGAYATITGATVVAGGTDPAFDIYRHLPTPNIAPTAALISPAAAGNIENGTHIYAVAFYNGAGITPPGPVTAAVTVVDKTANGKVTLSGLPIGPVGTTGRKLYRSAAGATALKLLATVANNTDTTYTDNIADGSLGAAKETVNAAAATALAATVKFSEAASDRLLSDSPQAGVVVSTLIGVILDPCTYSLRAVTGATTGALANLQAYLVVEYVPSA